MNSDLTQAGGALLTIVLVKLNKRTKKEDSISSIFKG